MTQEEFENWKEIVHRCFRCGYCKFTSNYSDINCPSYQKFQFETYSTGGRMWLIYALCRGKLEWEESIANVLYACSTCGNCMENCRFDKFNHLLVDFIELARVEAVQNGYCPEKQKQLLERTTNPEMFNPYGEKNADNEELKKEHDIPDEAEWVYFIGCTSNYRQQKLRDDTIRFLKKAGTDFTLIDEHCCTSPLIRTGQVEPSKEFLNYNIKQIQNAGASNVVTSCAGCYRTIKEDCKKLGLRYDFEVFHTAGLIKDLLDKGVIEIGGRFEKRLTYHDPCHLGRHAGVYEAPREVYKQIPGIEFVEMRRNRENSWCCGAGGGVKIGYPDWALEISKDRLTEAQETSAEILSSTCPFCRTNLSDANDKYEAGFEVLDLIEILDTLEIKRKK
ncbi:MAG: (Fe-S)-binding protein [Promethearchaeia archaeon]